MIKQRNLMKENIINYLPVGENEIRWGITVSSIGYQFVEAKSDYPVKGHPIGYTFNPRLGRVINEYAIIYITKGSGVFNSVDTGIVQLKEGDIFFISPGQWHSYQPNPQTGWDEYWVTFHGPNCDLILEEILNIANPVFNIGMNEKIVHLFCEMQEYANNQNAGFQRVLSGIIMHILGLIHSINKNQTFKDKDIQLIQKACILMRENICNKLKPEDISEKLNLSYSRFRKLFKQYAGIAPHQYMLQMKLEKIKDLLGSTDMQIQDIALELGFESADYFSYFFKSKTGINPLSYRKEIEQQREKACNISA